MQTRLTAVWEAVLALPTWQGVALVVGCSLVLAKVIQVGGDVVIRRLTRRIPGEVDDVVFATVHPPLYVTVVLVGAVAGISLLGEVSAYASELRAALVTVLTVLWVYALTRLGRRVSDEATQDDRFDNQVVPIFQNVWTAVVLGVGFFLVLSVWNVDVTPLLASAGILGIVLGLAARDTIANFFGSIALYADRTYAVGDYVVLESGERGRVEDVSIRSTDIRTREDLLVTVPNSQLNTATIVNESTPERERRIEVTVGIAYDSDLEHVETVLRDVAARTDLVIDDPAPRVRMREFDDSAITVDLLCWISGPTLRGRTRHELIKAVHAAFRAEAIEIPYPQRVVRMAGGAEAEGDELAPDRATGNGAPADGRGEAASGEGGDAADGKWTDASTE
jgi:small-conductance mechanosensitive channel